ncbi:TraB/GumN family protein [Candidatus Woesearchaeota archaeon]|nr:TraB/GumN family protein [Candidatus Woesearchaeota archaeon]
MINYQNLIIIGTSHISPESIKEVQNTITKEYPDLIALELDPLRFKSLIATKTSKLRIRDIFKIGLKGFIINLIGAWIEKKLGKIVNTKPGDEMRAAIKLAKENNIKIALIDQDIRITLKKLSKRITWKEKLNLLKEILKALFKRKRKLPFDITKVPPQKIIANLTKKIKKNYPSIYLTLIEERNYILAKNLYNIMKHHNKIIAVIGAGHEKEVLEIIIKEATNEIHKTGTH